MPTCGTDALSTGSDTVFHRFIPMVQPTFCSAKIRIIIVAPFFYGSVVGGEGAPTCEHCSYIKILIEPALRADLDSTVGFAFVGNKILSTIIHCCFRIAETKSGSVVVEEFDLFGAEGVVVDAHVVDLTGVVSGSHESEFDRIGGNRSASGYGDVIPLPGKNRTVSFPIDGYRGRSKSGGRYRAIGGGNTCTTCELEK